MSLCIFHVFIFVLFIFNANGFINHAPSLRPAVNSHRTTSKLYAASLLEYLSAAQALGPVRFVVVGTGAILETVGSFENMRVSDSPKGQLVTFSTDDPCFECHIRMQQVKQIKQVEVEKFGRQLRIARFLDDTETTVLSAILHDVTDQDTARIDAWEKLKTQYGEAFDVEI